MKRSPAWIMALASLATVAVAATSADAQWGMNPYSYAPGGYPAQQAYYMPPAMPQAGHGGYGGYAGGESLAGYNSPLVVHDPHVMPVAFGCRACGGGGCDACGGGAATGLFQQGAVGMTQAPPGADTVIPP
ncbi:MAG: hypothetical protein KY475_15530 [Planctomycetes bacterium]|nr:hypothetical protein [Planctomycetota bacterium]